jgi:hypothetical protein
LGKIRQKSVNVSTLMLNLNIQNIYNKTTYETLKYLRQTMF